MVKYIGPKLKIQRRLGKIFSLAKQKNGSKILSPGEHGKNLNFFMVLQKKNCFHIIIIQNEKEYYARKLLLKC